MNVEFPGRKMNAEVIIEVPGSFTLYSSWDDFCKNVWPTIGDEIEHEIEAQRLKEPPKEPRRGRPLGYSPKSKQPPLQETPMRRESEG